MHCVDLGPSDFVHAQALPERSHGNMSQENVAVQETPLSLVSVIVMDNPFCGPLTSTTTSSLATILRPQKGNFTHGAFNLCVARIMNW